MGIPDFLFVVKVKGLKHTVRFIDLNAQETGSLDGSFTSRDEAIKAFQVRAGQAAISLVNQVEFSRNVRSLAQYKRYDRQREEEKRNKTEGQQ